MNVFFIIVYTTKKRTVENENIFNQAAQGGKQRGRDFYLFLSGNSLRMNWLRQTHSAQGCEGLKDCLQLQKRTIF